MPAMTNLVSFSRLLLLTAVCVARDVDVASSSSRTLMMMERKARVLNGIRGLQQDSQVTLDAYAHLLEIIVDEDGNPNPRRTCSKSTEHAMNYIEQQMNEMGLIPLGDSDRKSYSQTIEGTVHPSICPPGIRNILGMVEGTENPDEFVIYSAHHDGPKNGNPQTVSTRGMQDTNNAYDDGLAVAVGLAIAKQLVANPPLTSVIFFFDDGEEGWSNLDEPAREAYTQGTEWGTSLNENTNPDGYLLGATYWARNPTVALEQVKVAFVVDPLGSPYNLTQNYLVAIGAETSTYKEAGNLNDFMDEISPPGDSVKLLKATRGSINGLGSVYNVLSKQMPSIWLAQPAFQKYHGGQAIGIVKTFFQNLDLAGYPIGNESMIFPSTAYFSVDNLDAFYRPNLGVMVDFMLELVTNSANDRNLDDIKIDEDRQVWRMEPADMQNVIQIISALLEILESWPVEAREAFRPILSTMQLLAQFLSSSDLSDDDNQTNAQLLARAASAWSVALDFFNADYPEGEAFVDQTYKSGQTSMEPYPTPSPLDPSPQSVAPTIVSSTAMPMMMIPTTVMFSPFCDSGPFMGPYDWDDGVVLFNQRDKLYSCGRNDPEYYYHVPNSDYYLEQRDDGNLLMFKNGLDSSTSVLVWQSGTTLMEGGEYMTRLQRDGNFITRNAQTGEGVWRTGGYHMKGHYFLGIRHDEKFLEIWRGIPSIPIKRMIQLETFMSSPTATSDPTQSPTISLPSNHWSLDCPSGPFLGPYDWNNGVVLFNQGDKLYSCGGNHPEYDYHVPNSDYYLRQRDDGNLLIFKKQKEEEEMMMMMDGDGDGHPSASILVWQSGVALAETGEYVTRLQRDGNLITRNVPTREGVWRTGGYKIRGKYFLGITSDEKFLEIWRGIPSSPVERMVQLDTLLS